LIPSGDGEHLNKEERCRAFNFKAASSRRDRGLKAAVARFGFFDACVHDEAMTERRRYGLRASRRHLHPDPLYRRNAMFAEVIGPGLHERLAQLVSRSLRSSARFPGCPGLPTSASKHREM